MVWSFHSKTTTKNLSEQTPYKQLHKSVSAVIYRAFLHLRGKNERKRNDRRGVIA